MPNTAPQFTAFDPSSRSFTEQTAYAIDPTAAVADAEFDPVDNWTGAEIVVTSSLADGSDEFDIGPLGFGLSRVGNDITWAGVTIATISFAVGSISILFTDANGEDPFGIDVTNVLRAITYRNTSDTPAADLVLTVTVQDHDSLEPLSDSYEIPIGITAVNDAPVLTGDMTGSVAQGGSYVVTLADLSFTDPDNLQNDITFATTSVSNGGVRVNGIAADVFTVADIAAGIVTFVHNGSPATSASFDVSVEDLNEDGSVPVPGTFNFAVNIANAPPEFAGVDESLRNIQEQFAPFAIASSTNGPLIVSDVNFDALNGGAGNYDGAEFLVEIQNDDGASVLDFAAMTSVTRVGNELRVGSVTIATISQPASSLSIVFTDANGTMPTRDLVNEVLQAITYANTSDNPLDVPTVSITFLDHDPVLPGQAQTSFQIAIQPVNDAPVLTGDLAGIVLQGGTRVLTPADLFFTDVDNEAGEIAFTIGGLLNGVVHLNGQEVSEFTAADIAAGLVSFVHDGSVGATAGFDFLLDDLDQDGSGPLTDILTFTVDDTNDGPLLTSGGGAATWNTTAVENTSQRTAELNLEALGNHGLVTFDFGQITAAVATVTATDPEESPLTYAIVGGADAALFSLAAGTLLTSGSTSGALYFVLPPGEGAAGNFEALGDANGDNIYEVIVRASDGVNTVDQTIQLTLQDIDEAPVFDNGLPGRLVGVVAGTTPVGTITATDDDGTPVTYALASGGDQGLFTIDTNTGALAFISPPTYGDTGSRGPNFYEVSVAATSGTQTTNHQVFVRVTDAGNTAPVLDGFAAGGLSITRGENQVSAGFELSGSDNEGQNSGNGFLWEIVSVANGGALDAALFTIDAASGVLTFASPPDHEAPADAGADNVYDVTVRLTDEFGAGLSDQETLSITIGPAINFAPTITGFTLTFGDAFNTPYAENFPYPLDNIIQATDPEGQTSGNGLVWEIVSVANGGAADADDFVINASTGALSFAARPDFEIPTDSNLDNTYQVTIKLTDNFGLGLSDQEVFTVHVTDVNDGGGGNANPTITGLDAIRQVQPQGTAILLDSNVDLADPELDAASGSNGNYTGARLIVQRQGGASINDDLGLNLTALLPLGITQENDGEFLYQGNVIARSTNFEPFGANGLLDITFASGATSAQADAIARAITIRNASPSDADYTMVYTFEDGQGGSVTDTMVISANNGGSNADLITSNGGRATAIIAAIENATRVMTFTADDPDSLPKAFSLDGGADAGLFTIDAQTGVLTFNAAPDFEAPGDADGDNVYDVVVRVETTGIFAGLFDTQQLSIALADIPGLVLEGTAGANFLLGSVEDDILNGNGGNDTLIGGGSTDTLNGGAGFDTASYAGATGIVLADLDLGLATAPGHGIDILTDIENLSGGNFGDTLLGNAIANRLLGGFGNDTLDGRGGNDVLTGGYGRDIMTGGLGADDFDFNSVREMAKTVALRDVITDFAARLDDIDLSTMDASSRKAGNQAFKFIGTQKFHKQAGELHYVKTGGNTIVEGDTNGDGKADFQIELTGLRTLGAGDFIL